MANKIQVLVNIPFIVQFKFDKPKIWDNVGNDGKAYQTFSYAVIHQGVDTYLSADWKLQPMLEQLGSLKDRELQLLKYQDGKYTNWKIMDVRGNDITPGTHQAQNLPPTSYSNPQSAPSTTPSSTEALERKIKVSFEQRDKKIAELTEKLEELTKQMGNFAFIFQQHSPDAFKIHSKELPTPIEPEIPVI